MDILQEENLDCNILVRAYQELKCESGGRTISSVLLASDCVVSNVFLSSEV